MLRNNMNDKRALEILGIARRVVDKLPIERPRDDVQPGEELAFLRGAVRMLIHADTEDELDVPDEPRCQSGG